MAFDAVRRRPNSVTVHFSWAALFREGGICWSCRTVLYGIAVKYWICGMKRDTRRDVEIQRFDADVLDWMFPHRADTDEDKYEQFWRRFHVGGVKLWMLTKRKS